MFQGFSFRCVGMLALLLFTFGCSQESASKDSAGGEGQRGGRGRGQRGASGQVINVQTTTVQRVAFQRSVDLSGTLISPDQARVSSEVAGIVRDVLVEIGQEVSVGQELVRLDTTELNLALQRAESALRQTEAQLGITSSGAKIPPDEQIASVRTAAANRDDAKAQLKRAEEGLAKGVLARAEYETVQTRVKITEAAYQAALEDVQSVKASLQDRRAAHELAKKKVEDAVIRAPVPGAVSERTVQRGEFIRENTPVVTIVRMNPLKLRVAVQEKYANLIRPNQTMEFEVEPYPNEMFRGRIAFISPAIEQGSRTFAAEILVDNPGRRLKPGFFAKGKALVQVDEGVLAVPEETISVLAGVNSVYVIQDGVVKQTAIQVGEKEGKFVEVLGGLKGDEVLASSNLNELVSGAKVGNGGGEEEAGPAAGGTPAAGGNPAEAGQRRGGGRRGGREGRGNAQ